MRGWIVSLLRRYRFEWIGRMSGGDLVESVVLCGVRWVVAVYIIYIICAV